MAEERRSVCVGASAGSGKTTRLVGEYFEHVEEGVGTQSILALTFNDEAAASMREKIRERTLKLNDEKLFDQLNWAQVQTFHSFCSQVLREFHLQAGVPSDFTVIEDMDMRVILQESWEELVSLDDGEFRRTFVKVCSPISHWRLQGMMLFLYERRARAMEALQAMDDENAFRRRFQETIEEHLDDLDAYLRDDDALKAIDELLRLADMYAEEGGDQAASYLFDSRPIFKRIKEGERNERLLAFLSLGQVKGSRSMGSVKKLSGDKELLVQSYSVLKGRIEDMEFDLNALQFDLDPRCLDVAVEHLLDLRRIFLRFASIVDARKAERRALDFNDLLIKAQQLLEPNGPNAVLELLRKRYKQVLVDEYQDTDVPQDRIVRALLGDDERKLFVVGDGKQSIYLFRGADVCIFKGMLRFVETELSGRKEELGNNYRSTVELVSFVNALFSRIMIAEDNDWEFRYLKVEPVRINDEGSVTIVQVPAVGMNDKLEMARAVADQIRRMVKGDGRMVHWDGVHHLDGPRKPEYGDITILLRARTNLRYYESVLAENGIPYSVEKGVGFFQRQEIMDIGNLVNFLGNQMDDISLYGILRSPYFGLSDAVLFRMARSSTYGSLFSKLKRFSKENPEEVRARKASAVLGGLLQRSGSVPVSEVLNDALQETGVLGIYAGMAGGRQAIANIERMLEMVRTREQEGFFTLFDLKDWLALSVDDSDKEGQAQLEASGDAVRIMTVHASKGLEFPIVILPETDVAPRNDSDDVALTDAGLFAEVPSPDPMITYAPAPMRRAGERMQAKSEAQNLRLFYVAATRAKDHLVMLGTRKRKEGEWQELGEDERNWFSLTMNALELSSVDDGVMEFDGERTMVLRMETFEDSDTSSGSLVPEPCSVPSIVNGWAPGRDGAISGQVKVVLPSALDSEVEESFKGAMWSPVKALLMSKGMDAASYGTLVHEVLRGKSVRMLLSMQGLELSSVELSEAIDGLEGIRERFLSTDIMRNRMEGGMDLQELPFELRDGDTLYMGVIDRLVQMKDGSWALIDYKTVSHGADDREVVSSFKEQMMIYKDATRRMVGDDVAEFIFLTESSRLVGL
ncbi:MAG: UvrD-helicase domain-containing protein [Euryarchaeota archaeon]|nr:UvrD-helicase domain-containing protein [Euryarchaeota archaeon]